LTPLTLTLDTPRESEQELRQRYQRAQRRNLVLRILLGVGLPLALLALWQLAAVVGWLDRRFFPPPTKVVSTAASFLASSEGRDLLRQHLGATLYRLAFGYSLGASFGVATGTLMGLARPARYALAPLIYGLFPLPKIAIYPLVIIIFGLGDASSVALITLGVFFMTCINTLSGVLHIAPIYQDVAAVFRIPAMTRWFRVILPAAMPAIVTGLRLGLGQALILVVSTEFISADTGIGRFIWDAWQVLDIPRMFVGLACVLCLGALSALAGNLLERHFVPWIRH
jgi:ABC-type nitrate/sulfonate/bicarbonate transport system permease component